MTEVYEAGEPISQSQWEAFERLVDQSLATAALATFLGSLPPGAPSDGVDSHGEALRHALVAKPALIKVNALEASDIVGRAIHSTADAVVAAGFLRERSRSVVIICLGIRGQLLWMVRRHGTRSRRHRMLGQPSAVAMRSLQASP